MRGVLTESRSNHEVPPEARLAKTHFRLHPVAQAICRVHESLQFEKSVVESFEFLHLSGASADV